MRVSKRSRRHGSGGASDGFGGDQPAFASCWIGEYGVSVPDLRFVAKNAREFAMLGFIGTYELMILMLVIVVLFGSSRLPSLMRNLGRSATEFKKGMRDEGDETSTTIEDKSKSV